MAIDLKAVFRVQDKGTSALRRIMQQTSKVSQATEKLSRSNQQAAKTANSFRDANGRLRDAMGRYINESNKASNASKRFATSLNGVRVGSSGISASLGGMQSALFGLVGAYVSAQAAASAFNATIGAAARYEQSEVAVHAIFNDKAASDAYLKLVDKMAIDSPLLNSGEMLGASKGLVAMTKDVNELGKAWSIIEKLMVLDPTQGTDGAAFALKEMWQGDALSMVERFGLSKKDLNRIKKLAIPQQIAEINKLLDGMGITEKTVNSMGQTTLGYWAQIQERVDKVMRTIGGDGNSKLGKALEGIVNYFDNTDLDGMAARIGDRLGEVVEKAITIGQWLWKWREPIAYATAAVTAALTAFMAVGAIALLANPIALIAAGVAAAAVGFKALYDNSESFRGVISGIAGIMETIGSFIGPVVGDFFTTLSEYLGGGLFTGILSRDQGAVSAAVKIGSGIRAAMEIAGSAMQKVSDFVTTLKEQFSGGLFTGILGRDQGAVQSAMATADFLRNAFENISNAADAVKPTFERFKAVFSQVWTTISGIVTSAWTIIQPILSGLGYILQAIGVYAAITFNNIILPALQFMAQLFATLWAIARPILTLLGGLFEVLAAIVLALWKNALAPLIAFIASGVKNAFDNLSGVLEVVAGWFDKLNGFVGTAKDKLSQFADFISGITLPDWVTSGISTVVTTVGKVVGAGNGHSHYHGLDDVPYDGYSARLHRGEGVLTAQENREYQSAKSGNGSIGGANVTIAGNTFMVREEADIRKIAAELADLIEEGVSVGV